MSFLFFFISLSWVLSISLIFMKNWFLVLLIFSAISCFIYKFLLNFFFVLALIWSSLSNFLRWNFVIDLTFLYCINLMLYFFPKGQVHCIPQILISCFFFSFKTFSKNVWYFLLVWIFWKSVFKFPIIWETFHLYLCYSALILFHCDKEYTWTIYIVLKLLVCIL